MVGKIRNIFRAIYRHEKIFVPLAILLFTIILAIPLYKPGYSVGHDSEYHVVSIIGLSDSTDGKIITGMHDIGYGEGIFYPQLSHYIGVFFYRLIGPFGFSALLAAKMANIFMLFCSGLAMYIFLRAVLGEKAKWRNMVATYLYMGATYHMSCILIRDAMAETALYMFIPIVALSVFYLMKNNYKNFLLAFVIGVVGCINSHLVLTVWLAALCFVFAIYEHKIVFTRKNILYVLLGCAISLLITLSFWGFMLICKGACDYYVFSDKMVTNGFGRAHVNLIDMLRPQASMSSIRFWLDIVALVFCAYMAFFTKKINKKYRGIVRLNLIIIAVLMILVCGIIPIWTWPRLFSTIQFAWRLVTFMVFLLAFSLAICLNYTPKNIIPALSAIIIASIVTGVFSINGYVKYVYTVNQLDRGNVDYLPIAMLNNYSDETGYMVDQEHIVLKPEEGRAEIRNMINHAASFDFDIETNSKTEVSLPRAYYWGYEATIEYEDGETKTVDVDFDELGYILLTIDRSAHVKLRYTGKAALSIMRAISGITAVSFAGTYIVIYVRSRKSAKK